MIDMKFEYTKYLPINSSSLDDACNKNRVICHPDDYKKLAESGVIEALTKGGIEVISCDLAKKGKQMATGELAVAAFKQFKIKGY